MILPEFQNLLTEIPEISLWKVMIGINQISFLIQTQGKGLMQTFWLVEEKTKDNKKENITKTAADN